MSHNRLKTHRNFQEEKTRTVAIKLANEHHQKKLVFLYTRKQAKDKHKAHMSKKMILDEQIFENSPSFETANHHSWQGPKTSEITKSSTSKTGRE